MSGHLQLVATTALPVLQGPIKGRHATDWARRPYLDAWAERYPASQASVERGRLKQGKARHRAHRDPLPMKAGRK